MSVPCALAIAGSDSGGGAGIQADLKTFAAFGVHGTTSITAVTAQNTREVSGVYEVAPAAVAAQIDAVMEDIGADAAKTGMLVNAGIVEAVADRVRAHHLFTLVVDPVMVATTGAPLLDPGGVHALKTLLLPRAHVVTPNLAEASALAGRDIESLADMRRGAGHPGPGSALRRHQRRPPRWRADRPSLHGARLHRDARRPHRSARRARNGLHLRRGHHRPAGEEGHGPRSRRRGKELHRGGDPARTPAGPRLRARQPTTLRDPLPPLIPQQAGGSKH